MTYFTHLRRCRQGYTLLELSLALIFGATVIAGATYTYTNLAEQNRTATFMTQHNQLVGKVGQYLMDNFNAVYDPATIDGCTAADLRCILYKRGVIPQNIGQGQRMASGSLAAIDKKINNTDGRQVWSVTYQHISRNSCQTLLETSIGINNPNIAMSQKLYQVDTSTGVGFFTLAQRANNFTRPQLINACPNADNDVTLTYIFG